MKIAAALALSLAWPTLVVAADDAQSRLDARAEACISAGAPDVARAETNLAAAVDFLTSDLCAREVEIAGKYRANRKLLDLLIKQQKQSISHASTVAAPLQKGASAGGPAAMKPAPAPSAKDTRLAGLEAASVDPETGDLVGAPGPYSMISDLAGIVFGFRPPQASAGLRAFAARAVLAARPATR